MPRDLIVPLDGSSFADAVLPHAMELARLMKARLVLLRVHSPFAVYFAGGEPALMMPNPELQAVTEQRERDWLSAKHKSVARAAGVDVTSEFRIGAAAEEIVACAEGRDTLAIVCATHGRGGWAPEWLGSVTDAVIRHTEMPVIALNQAATARAPGGDSMLILLDGSPESESILEVAVPLARAMEAEVTLARVTPPEWVGDALMLMPPGAADPMGVDAYTADAKVALDETAAGLRKQGLRVRCVVISDANPIRAILELIKAEDHDLVAAATSSRGISRLLLRSVSEKVLRAGGRPTLLVHQRVPARAGLVPKAAPVNRRRRKKTTIAR
jgi:nucleotide-binding universal stress UspA family protein